MLDPVIRTNKYADLMHRNVNKHDHCIIGNGSLNETFGEYSPQNSDFVHVFTEVGTPSQQKVNNVTNNGHEDNEFLYSQPSQESVYVPQQEFIAKLDYDLADLPKETYISKLIEKTNNSDDCLTWYRSTLAGRAKSIQGCPTGKLNNRKSTTKSTSTSKYARDCYIIYMFLQGDKTQIDEVFRKDDNKLSVVEHNNEVVSNEIIEMRANIHILLERVSEPEKSDQKHEKNKYVEIIQKSALIEFSRHANKCDGNNLQIDSYTTTDTLHDSRQSHLSKSEDIQRTLPCRQQTIDLDSGHLWAHSHLGPGKKDQLRVQGSGMSKMPHRYLILSRTSRLTWPSASMK
ncbi:unnamed protein product [Mytilus edulis]|uniref:Uncharacterized protein n=1 Tax=Mytilus edulis TaxID=6550 RepID=A0A8S3QG69_MYTED|nr:unnamed protein product [Mytilus edulis]